MINVELPFGPNDDLPEKEELIRIELNLSVKEVERLSKSFSKENILVKELIFKLQNTLFYKYFHQKNRKKEEAVLLAHIDALSMIYNRKSAKNRSMNLFELEDIIDLEVKRFQKSVESPKGDFIINHIYEVDSLKQNDISYRDIAKYFNRRYRKSISHTHIREEYQHWIDNKELSNG